MRLIGLTVILIIGLVAALLGAEAQQATKNAQIGYLAPNLAASRHLPEAFVKDYVPRLRRRPQRRH